MTTTSRESNPVLGAYFLRGGMFTCVPKHLRLQLDEMAAWGTNVIALAVSFADMGYNQRNLDFLVEEIHRRGMKVYFVPSILAGITAGVPLEACGLGYQYPHTWVCDREGKPIIRGGGMGILCSFYHPEVEDHFKSVAERMITQWPIDGIVWDEPKSTNWQDFSPAALKNNPTGDERVYLRDYAAFFTRINAHIKQVRPDVVIVHFDEACRRDPVVEESVKIGHLDYFGVDGRPWAPVGVAPDAVAENIRPHKTLIHFGERYLAAARANGLKTFALYENQQPKEEEYDLIERDLEKVAALDVDMLFYYYYGFSQPDPERNMELVRRLIKLWRKS